MDNIKLYEELYGSPVKMNDRFESVHIWGEELAKRNAGKWEPMLISQKEYLSSLPDIEVKGGTAEEVKTEFYTRFGAGDFQNETDLLDVDKAWEWFNQRLSEAKKEIEKDKSSLTWHSEKLQHIIKENDLLQSELSAMRERVEKQDKEIERLNLKLNKI